MNESIQQIILAYQKLKSEKFPDHVCAQANRIMCAMSGVIINADLAKFHKGDETSKQQLKQSLINTAAQCIRMIDELEK